ncbi:GNAT family N-acetyltransferase [bacterium]|nr:GNAT family N-acetyltransferase [bacterium]
MDISFKKDRTISDSERKRIDKAWKVFDKNLYGQDYVSLGTFYFKAYDNNQLIGLITADIEGGVVVIDEFIVLEKYRGQGVGVMLINNLIKFAKRKKCRKITLETDPRIRTASFYKKIGFIQEAKVPNNFAKNDSVILSMYLK